MTQKQQSYHNKKCTRVDRRKERYDVSVKSKLKIAGKRKYKCEIETTTEGLKRLQVQYFAKRGTICYHVVWNIDLSGMYRTLEDYHRCLSAPRSGRTGFATGPRQI